MTIDINTWLGHWPFRPFRIHTAKALAAHLAQEGIKAALVSSPEAVFEFDPGPANARLIKCLAHYSRLHPCPVVNPLIAGAADRLKQYARTNIRAIRLLPNYQGWELKAAPAAAVWEACRDQGLMPIVQMRLDDERAHHPSAMVPGVSARELTAIARARPDMKFVACCAYFAEAVQLGQDTDNVFVDIAFAESLNTLPSLLAQIPACRIVFGSHTPFLYTRAAIMKVHAPGNRKPDRDRILYKNSSKLLGL
ncbi:amidohydrolase family protein [Planctomycetota bacterium]